MGGHIPERSCCICRKRFPKRELTRYVKQETAGSKYPTYLKDSKQILPGRGIYLCQDKACNESGRKRLSMAAEIKD